MIKVMVIDDEAKIRKGLMGYIDWTSLDCNVVKDFENGRLAIDYLADHPVDLIISDIKMPGADGLEVSKFIHHHAPNTRIILYTGYSDFNYAQTAIAFGVADFIVKPSSMEEIMRILKKNIEKIKKQQEKDRHLNTLENQLENVQEYRKQSYIKKFIVGEDVDRQTVKKALEAYNSNMESYCLLLYQIKRKKTIFHHQTLQFINLSLSDFNQYTFTLNQSTYGTLVFFDKPSQKNPIRVLEAKCNEINDFVIHYIKGSIFIGLSDIHYSLEEAPVAYTEAQRCLDYSFYGDNPLILYRQLKNTKNNPTYVAYNLEKISQYLVKGDATQSTTTITSMLKIMADNREPVDYIKSMGVAIYTVAMSVVKKHNLTFSDIFSEEEPYRAILEAECIDDLIDTLNDMVNTIIHYLSIGNNNYIIKQAMNYIHNHYNTPIKLQNIADHIHINSSYLSRLFKDKTNQTITQTLRDIRIEKAKVLLKDYTNKTYDVASMVGFDDAAYFSYVFKKETGYSPSQYKNLNS